MTASWRNLCNSSAGGGTDAPVQKGESGRRVNITWEGGWWLCRYHGCCMRCWWYKVSPMIFSAVVTICCRVLQSGVIKFPYHTVRQLVRKPSTFTPKKVVKLWVGASQSLLLMRSTNVVSQQIWWCDINCTLQQSWVMWFSVYSLPTLSFLQCNTKDILEQSSTGADPYHCCVFLQGCGIMLAIYTPQICIFQSLCPKQSWGAEMAPSHQVLPCFRTGLTHFRINFVPQPHERHVFLFQFCGAKVNVSKPLQS